MTEPVFTIGHSTRPIDDFVALLRGHGVRCLLDVRTVPKSRHNPQFESRALAASLAEAGIAYEHVAALGGFRKPRPDSPNAGWRNTSFRGYADYMQTPEFARALDGVVERAQGERVALMCAESVPWRCHRSLVADALLARGVDSFEIASATSAKQHALPSFARLGDDGELTYPPEPDLLSP